MTALQIYLCVLGELVLDAREELSEEEYSWFVAVATNILATEDTRLFLGETLRATREENEAA